MVFMQTWVEIDAAALKENVATYRRLAPRSKFMAIVKSNAYGHDLNLTVNILKDCVDGFGVNSIGEARDIRSLGYRGPVLIMGKNDPGYYGDIAAFDALTGDAVSEMVVSGIDDIRELMERSPRTPFHVKVDTGMSRLGVHDDTLGDTLSYLSDHNLPFAGMMTHFANVEDVTDQAYAKQQLDIFTRSCLKAEQMKGIRPLQHAAASAAAMILPASQLDWIRIGISLYGLWASDATRISARTLYGNGNQESVPELYPALTWKSQIVHFNRVPAGTYVGYGCTYRTVSDTTIAVIPVGYYEGYDRRLTGRSHVLIRGRRAPLIGRVCMNMIMVDVSHIPDVAYRDEVVLLGKQGDEVISADELASISGTINYETVTRIESHIPRIEKESQK